MLGSITPDTSGWLTDECGKPFAKVQPTGAGGLAVLLVVTDYPPTAEIAFMSEAEAYSLGCCLIGLGRPTAERSFFGRVLALFKSPPRVDAATLARLDAGVEALVRRRLEPSDGIARPTAVH